MIIEKMNPEVKQKWVDALRSGKYSQGMHNLRCADIRAGYEYCCLGVLTDIYRKEKKVGWNKVITSKAGINNNTLSPKVMEWAGFTFINPVVAYQSDHYNFEDCGINYTVSASAVNDIYGLNFNEIASLIEKNL